MKPHGIDAFSRYYFHSIYEVSSFFHEISSFNYVDIVLETLTLYLKFRLFFFLRRLNSRNFVLSHKILT